jgi:hypothetical protein
MRELAKQGINYVAPAGKRPAPNMEQVDLATGSPKSQGLRGAEYASASPGQGIDALRNLITQQASSMNPGDLRDIPVPSEVPGVPDTVVPGRVMESAYKNVVAPLGMAGVDQLESVTSPESAGLMFAADAIPGASPMLRLLKAGADVGFKGQMAAGAGRQIGGGLASAEQGNTPEAVRQLAGGALSAGMAVSSPKQTADAVRQIPADINAATAPARSATADTLRKWRGRDDEQSRPAAVQRV